MSELRDGSCFRAEFQFVVDTSGVPEIETIRKVTATNVDFQEAVKDVIPRLRYEPARLNGVPVRQMVAFQQSVAIRRVVRSSSSAGPPSARPARC